MKQRDANDAGEGTSPIAQESELPPVPRGWLVGPLMLLA